MKKIKKLASFLLALGMIFALSATAFAAVNDGSITIENATVGETYAVYKVFDLTYSDANGTVAYSYTRTGTDDALYDVLRGADSPFTLTATTTENVYAVSLQDGKTATDVSKFLSANESLLTQTGDTQTATSTTVTFSNLPYGYYYITSNLGSVVTIDSAMPAVTVIDKNQTPSWDPENPAAPDQSGDTGKFVAEAADGTYGKTSTAAIGDTAYFKINAYAPKYAGDKLVDTYTFTDTLAAGFTYNNDLKVTMNGDELSEGTNYTVSVSADGQTITVTVEPSKIANYPADAHLSITYSAKVDADAVYDNVNKANMSWTVYPNDPDTGDPDKNKNPYDPNNPGDPNYPDPNDPNYPKEPNDPKNPPESQTDTYTFGFNIQKYKESVADENKLEGAKFKLYDAETGGNEIAVVRVSDGVYRVAEATEEGVEIEAGSATIKGLDAKTYYLEETVAPDGYNKLTERKSVEIKAETETGDPNVDDNGILNETINVINNAGTLLPSTGGIGTTIFYVLGGVLVVGAGVLLIVRKRMSSEK